MRAWASGSTTSTPRAFRRDPPLNIECGYVNVDEPVLEWVRHPSNRVHKKAEEWNEYEKRFPAMADKKIFLSIDEYGYGGGSFKSALAYGMILNEMFRHTDFMKMAAYTMAISTLESAPPAPCITRGASLQDVPGTFRHVAGGLHRQFSAAGAEVSALWGSAGNKLGQPDLSARYGGCADRRPQIPDCCGRQRNESEQKFDLNVAGVRVTGPSTQWQMTGSSLDAENHVGQPTQVAVKEIALGEAPKTISVVPTSINIYRFTVQ